MIFMLELAYDKIKIKIKKILIPMYCYKCACKKDRYKIKK